MSTLRIGRNDPCTCGSGKKYKQCCLPQQQAAAASPARLSDTEVSRLINEAAGLFQRDKLDQANQLCDRILAARPDHGDALHLRGLISHFRGDQNVALDNIERALGFIDHYSVHCSRGLVLQSLGRFEDAAESFRRALARSADMVELHCNLGGALLSQGLHQQAFDAYDKAVRVAPSFVRAYTGRAGCSMLLGNLDQAELDAQQALALAPTDATALACMGEVCWAQQRVAAAQRHFEAAVKAAPNNSVYQDNLGMLLSSIGEFDAARRMLNGTLARDPSIEREIQAKLMLPAVVRSREEMLSSRTSFELALDGLTNSVQPVDKVSARLFCSSVFYLAYHGLDDRALRVKLSRFYERLCPTLRYEAPHISPRDRRPGPLRVGFFSGFVHDHPVARCFSRLIEQLSLDPRLHVHLISTKPLDSAAVQGTYGDFRGSKVQVSDDYLGARGAIAGLELDVLIYQDIGMEILSYFLAHGKLAHIQCSLGGHPETTGIEAIDYFLSTADCESETADAHYVEKLVRLPVGVAQFKHPVLPPVFKSRAELGLPLQGRLYLCPMMLQKLHPDFDTAIEQILQRDPQGHVVLFEHTYLPWADVLRERFEHSIESGVRGRVHFMPWIKEQDDFLAVNAHADVVLDPYHFGIGSTAIATFAVGTPIVTWPGEFMRGRGGLAYCRQLGVESQCVATDWPDYVDKAVAIASSPTLRAAISERIVASKHLFFENQRSVKDVTDFLLGLWPIISPETSPTHATQAAPA